jgi:hypothetical protein
MTTLEAIVMKEHDKDKNILTILKYFSIDWIKKTCWKEIVNLGMEVTTLIEAVEASDNSISGMLRSGAFNLLKRQENCRCR